MRIYNFAKRNFKEITRDPLSIIFSILLPLFLLIIFQQIKIPGSAYSINNFTPGIIIFSFSFITLFTATLVAKDRSSALIMRLCASPMKTYDYILGYTLSVMPIVLLQVVLFLVSASFFGLDLSLDTFLSGIASLPISLLFILLGILLGSVTTEKSASGVSSVVVQLVAFTSGMYFSSDMIGKGFDVFCRILPFSSCLNIVKDILNRTYSNLLKYIIIVALYICVTALVTSFVFAKKIRSDNK